MPIYAYRCSACGHAKDVLQKMSDPVLSTCPACGAAAFCKQLTAAGFQLKGSGWYATDFKGGAAAPSAEPKDDGKPDAKPDAKPDGKSDAGKSDAGKPDAGKTDVKPAAGTATASAAPASHGGGSCACH